MQYVTDVTGQVHSFPNEATPEMIAGALGLSNQQAPTQQTLSAAPDQQSGLFRLPELVGTGLVRGTAHGLGVFGDLENAALAGMSKLTGDESYSKENRLFPDTNELLGQAGKMGLLGDASLLPQSGVERLLSGGAEGLGSALPYATLGSGSLSARLLENLGVGTGSGIAAEASNELVPGTGGGAGALVGFGAQGILSKIDQVLSNRQLLTDVTSAGDKVKAAQDSLTAAQRAAVDSRAAAAELARTNQIADQASFQQQKSALAGVRDTEIQRHQANADASLAAADAIDESIAGQHGTSQTLQEAGGAIQDAVRQWRATTFPQRLETLWSPINEQMSNGSGQLNSFTHSLGVINRSAGELEPLAQAMKPGLPQALQQRLDQILGQRNAEAKLAGGSADAMTFSWPDVQTLRSTLGDAMSNPRLVNDIGEANMSRLYASLSADMRGMIRDPALLERFDQANQASRQLYSVAEGPMSRIATGTRANLADDPLPEQVASRLLSGAGRGGSDLAVLRQEIPQAVDELAAAQLRQGGWARLAPEAQAELVDHPGLRQQLDAAAQLRDIVPTERDRLIGQARQNYAADVSSAAQQQQANRSTNQSAVTTASLAGRQQVRSAQDQLAEAKSSEASAKQALVAAGSPSSPVAEGMYHTLSAIAGGDLLGNLATILGHHFGMSELSSHAAGAVLGLMAPSIYRGVKSTVTHPSNLRLPALGAISGSNPLIPQQQ